MLPKHTDMIAGSALFDPDEYRSWKYWTDSAFGKTDEAQSLAFKAELRLAGLSLADKKRVLEIGFGNGAFANFILSLGWTFVGTELDPELLARASAKGWEVYPANSHLATIAGGKPFDLVTAFDVLEHLTFPEIFALLKDIRSVLAPNGKIIARFPSGDSPFSRSIQYGDLTHQTIIGSGIAVQMAMKTGFRVVQIRPPAFPVFGLGTKSALKRIVVLALRGLLTRIVNLSFHDNQKRVVEPNMVLVLEPDHRKISC